MSPEELALLERVAKAVVQRRLTVPALMCLESLRPLNYVSSQFMVFLEPLVGTFVATRDHERIAQILEHRESLQVLIDQIEAQDAVRQRAGKVGGP